MILPIVAYGTTVLKKKGEEISAEYPDLEQLIEDMYETMYEASGVGLAAPQIGKGIRLFVIDGSPFSDDDPGMEDFCMTFINPTIIEEEGEEWSFNEGCLSIPDVREDVFRKPKIKIKYQDEDFEWVEEEFDGLKARIIQHEYDHIEGVLFTDYLSPLKRRMLRRKLVDISKGSIKVSYRMKFPSK
ncbi:MAG: peptide deformylase [Flavobacteriales bacterium]